MGDCSVHSKIIRFYHSDILNAKKAFSILTAPGPAALVQFFFFSDIFRSLLAAGESQINRWLYCDDLNIWLEVGFFFFWKVRRHAVRNYSPMIAFIFTTALAHVLLDSAAEIDAHGFGDASAQEVLREKTLLRNHSSRLHSNVSRKISWRDLVFLNARDS